MTEDEVDAIAAIARAIQRYLAAHPTAADTAFGVQRWWLPLTLEEPLPLVELALDRLTEEGEVHRTTMEDGGVIYAGIRRRPWPVSTAGRR